MSTECRYSKKRHSLGDVKAHEWSSTVHSLVMDRYGDKFLKLQRQLEDRQRKFSQKRQNKMRNSWICTKQAPSGPSEEGTQSKFDLLKST